MIDSIASLSSAAGAAAMKKATGFSKDDFLTLFITQMKNQDPLSPMDSTEFLGQLAQLTQVEQAYNTNANLEKLMKQQDVGASLAAVSFIGRTVDAQLDRIGYDGTAPVTLAFSLPAAITEGVVTVKDGTGRTVWTAPVRNLPPGEHQVTWDGSTSSGGRAAAGEYQVVVSGTAGDGNSLSGVPFVRGVVTAVSLEGNMPQLSVGALSIPLSDVRAVRG